MLLSYIILNLKSQINNNKLICDKTKTIMREKTNLISLTLKKKIDDHNMKK